jgi:uncharacterized secreted protein with C-terminal beta-propeller domain
VAADAESEYLTANSLYVASTPCCTAAKEHTELHRFDLGGTERPRYRASGVVPGSLLRQSSLSEYDGSLRVATDGPDLVYLLRSDTLAPTGQLSGLARYQQVSAVRFAGPMGYLAAFERTKPVYELDLHDPAAPKLAGPLGLTGNSNYLHDAGESRLIGVGQKAGADGRMAGLQVSLADVGAPARPKLLSQLVEPDGPGVVSVDPQSFLYWQPTGLVVVPVHSWNTNTQSGKVLVLQVDGPRLRRIGTLTNPITPGAQDGGRGIQRSLLVDGKVWTMSSSGIQVSSPASLAPIRWIPFE